MTCQKVNATIMVQWFHFAILIVASFSTNEAAASLSPDSIHCLLFPKLTECYEKSIQSLKSWKSKTNNSKFNIMKNTLVRKSRSSGFQQYIPSDNVKLRKLADYCAKYNIQNQQLCQDPTTAVPTDPDVRKFCSAYRVICEQNSIGPSSWALRQPTWKTELYQRVAFNPNVKDFCNTFRLVAVRNCNGNEQGKFIELCSLYRQRCPYLAPSVEWPPWPRTANNSVLVQQLCEKYRFVYKANCPGYEVQQLRPYCNTYRVYCLGECPKMIIDGSVSVARNVWGVGGIPFYPFNPEGLVAGGMKTNVGFGDWGGSWLQSRGVTDFYHETIGAEGNWHAGSFGYRRSIGVPLAGVNVATGVGVGLGGVGLLGNLFSSSGKSITQFSSDLLRAGLIQHMPVV
ncbi:hypothetical protein T12_4448 [Trichinella patagoniensis]|uniref:FZ domain-containing protein n=1 Tax=Trichinella patagoniensis TaxID=990121 RepID=A0A0V1A2C9_9BILA|nr:hypothetical protein T12_4448 [Trichinella patagoniensis]